MMAEAIQMSKDQYQNESYGILWRKYNIPGVTREHHDLIKALFRMIEIKDMKTASHCKAVARYSRVLGKSLGMTEIELSVLWDAALVHDIGKIMVDKSIIYKREPLKRNELYQLQTHPQYGMEILESFHLSDSIVDAAWHHHERWDGTGYPEGIEGDNIRFMTQIVAAADMIDAMSANRAYRKALSFQEILAELHASSGTQLSPEVAEKAVSLIESGEVHMLG